MGLGIIELLQRVGEDAVRLQNLVESTSNISTSKAGVSTITFQTNGISASEVGTGRAKNVGLVLWLPSELVEAGKAAYAAGRPLQGSPAAVLLREFEEAVLAIERTPEKRPSRAYHDARRNLMVALRQARELEDVQEIAQEQQYALDVLQSHIRALAVFLCTCRGGEDGSADDFLDPAAHIERCPFRIASTPKAPEGGVFDDDNFALADDGGA